MKLRFLYALLGLVVPAGVLNAQVTEHSRDYEAFSGLYRNTPEEAIQSDFNSGLSVDTYDQTCYIPIVWEGPYAYVDCVYYIVAGGLMLAAAVLVRFFGKA